MKSNAAIAGHPIHAMLVAVPIGLFIWALIASVVYAASDSNMTWYEISYWTSIAAIIAAVIAAVPGIVDGLTIGRDSEARSTAMYHATLNIVVLGLFIAAALLMRNEGAVDGARLGYVIGLQAIAVSLLGISGWLGGEMVYKHHLGMVPENAEVEEEERRRHAPGTPHTGGRVTR